MGDLKRDLAPDVFTTAEHMNKEKQWLKLKTTAEELKQLKGRSSELIADITWCRMTPVDMTLTRSEQLKQLACFQDNERALATELDRVSKRAELLTYKLINLTIIFAKANL